MLPESQQTASAAVCARLAHFQPLLAAKTVMAYLAFRGEIDLSAVFEALPHIHWTVPRVAGKEMVAHVYDPAQLTRHRFGMLEPAPGLTSVEPMEIDAVLVPGVAFDRQGGRLGHGGGYYDRFLPVTRALRVGVTHSACLADDLPCSVHDARMDWVITPAEEIYCAPFWRDASQV